MKINPTDIIHCCMQLLVPARKAYSLFRACVFAVPDPRMTFLYSDLDLKEQLKECLYFMDIILHLPYEVAQYRASTEQILGIIILIFMYVFLCPVLQIRKPSLREFK